MSAHTPGPWTVTVRSSYCGDYLVKEAGPREDEANARLIAAAPELLEACERAIRYMDSRGAHDTADVARPIRAAIAKAKGGS